MTEHLSTSDFQACYQRIIEQVEFMGCMKLGAHEHEFVLDLSEIMQKYERAEYPQFNDGKVEENGS